MPVTAEQLEAIREQFASNRGNDPIDSLANEFARLARSSFCDWPAGSVQDYKAAILELVKRGELVLVNGSQVTRVGACGAVRLEVVQPAKSGSQMSLF